MIIHFNEPKHTTKNTEKKVEFIKKHSPKIIIFEYPTDSNKIEFLNKYHPNKKPKKIIEDLKTNIKENAKIYPWLKAELKIIELIEELWKEGKQIYLFNIDAPLELTSLCDDIIKSKNKFYFDLWNFLRELHMVLKIKSIRKHFSGKIIIFCHNSHWASIKKILHQSPLKTRFDTQKDFLKLNSKNKMEAILKKYYNLFCNQIQNYELG